MKTLLPLLCLLQMSTLLNAQPAFDDPAWRYVFRKPANNWYTPEFDDRNWREGFGGFGEPSTPGARVGTDWESDNIWLRRTVHLPAVPERPALLMHHDEDAEIYINGQQVAAVQGYVTGYQVVPLNAQQSRALQAGANLLAVHCTQRTGGQFIDVHLIDADHVPQLPPPRRREFPFRSELITTWGEKVTPDNAWTEYPRPGLVRSQWQNLNGHWDYAVTSIRQTDFPSTWQTGILVPFCLESRLSGVQRLLHADEALWYQRSFTVAPAEGERVQLNFEAVDYRCQVWVNQTAVGSHQGGHTPFSFDITDALQPGRNTLTVRVEDATEGSQLRGKQTLSPRGIWYTQVSGIWQTVWLETVPERHVADLRISTDAAAGSITVQPVLQGPEAAGEQLRVTVLDQSQEVARQQTAARDLPLVLPVPNARLWSPSAPHLYDLRIELLNAAGQVVDQVAAYAGIRSVGKTPDANGHLRFTLNGDILFHWGPLDQGWWPDGLLTPPSDAAMLSDIEFLRAAGFNMIRKHIKVEPRRYYYHCDRLGMLVWQDQVSGGPQPPWTRLDPNPRDADWTDADHAQFMAEFEAMISTLQNHPSIVVWTPFNEAWGQHRTLEVGRWTVARDPSRLVNIASGGNFWPIGDIVDEHRYPHPGFPFDAARYAHYIKVMGEFGGHGLPVTGHLWDANRRNWGYGDLPQNADEYRARYQESIRLLHELQKQGIAAGVYTQTTDVEGEINGLLTYDRRVTKIPAAELRAIHQPLFTAE